jgi:hypothetical protein
MKSARVLGIQTNNVESTLRHFQSPRRRFAELRLYKPKRAFVLIVVARVMGALGRGWTVNLSRGADSTRGKPEVAHRCRRD